MRNAVAASALVCFACAGAAAEERLPSTVAPTRYALTLAPDLAHGTFTGRETIDVAVRAPTQAIVLHAVDLAITEATVDAAGARLPARVTADPARQTITLALARPVQPGNARVAIAWSARLSDKLRGFYLVEEAGRRYAFTQFESIDARRAFPCFDEPSFKTPFEVTAVVDAGDLAVGNTAAVEERVDPATGKKTVRFAPTRPLPTYLVALAVGRFATTAVKRGRLAIRAVTLPGRAALAAFALDVAGPLVDAFADYFGVPYPYDKLDLVAVPDFDAGAMENAGAIFFRERLLLVDAARSSEEQRRDVIETVAHELGHQWFGDLVTMAWWDDLWLNEAFATWVAHTVGTRWRPSLGLWEAFGVGAAEALRKDELRATHPVRVPVASAEEADANFDDITYTKGAAVLRMLERYLGGGPFRRGLGAYLRAHADGNARADDLWRALAEASGQPVGEVATAWIDRPGHPVVTVETACRGGRTVVTLAQERLLSDGAAGAGERWPVPVCMRAGGATRCKLVRGERAEVVLPAPGCAPFVVVNGERAGFYRVRYPPTAMRALAAARAELAPLERMALLDDAEALARRGLLPLAAWLDTIAAFAGERSPDVIALLADQLRALDDQILDERDRDRFARLVDDVLGPAAREVGWRRLPGEDPQRARARALLFRGLGTLARRRDVLDEAARRLPSLLAADAPAPDDPSLADAVLLVAATDGDAARWDAIAARRRAAADPVERDRLLRALDRFRRPDLARRTLEHALSPAVAQQDVPEVLADLLERRATRALAWSFIKERFADIVARVDPAHLLRVVSAVGKFCDADAERDAAAFFADPAHRLPASQRAVAEALESIRVCAEFRHREAAHFSKWLRDRR